MNLVLQGVHQLALIHRASVDNIQSFLLARRAAVNVASCDALVVPLHLEGLPAHPSPKLSFLVPSIGLYWRIMVHSDSFSSCFYPAFADFL